MQFVLFVAIASHNSKLAIKSSQTYFHCYCILIKDYMCFLVIFVCLFVMFHLIFHI